MTTLLLLAIIATVLAMLVCALASTETSKHKKSTRHEQPSWKSRFVLGCQEALVLPASLWRQFRYRQKIIYGANIAEGTHKNSLTRKVDAVVATRYLLAKPGSDADHVAIGTANAIPLGVMTDEAAAIEDTVAVELLGISNRTLPMVASGVINVGTFCYTAAGGKVSALSAVAGTYYLVGTALQTSADGDTIEVAHCHPRAVIVE